MRLIQDFAAHDNLLSRMMLRCSSFACEWAVFAGIDLLITLHRFVSRTRPASQVSASPVDKELRSKVREFSRCWFSRCELRKILRQHIFLFHIES
ncbi:hypothetical protein Spb1_21050 [Planctopirus ephydatiae]|uniref:Uncharacterized protein n=1 Tax=Planctopirus ephydatiae TaxID=2528019 RepID=A0A518GNL6_9PLAN|nr:hypothetical protein Spb1_21050 [Planctopirus ephydatiae]